MLIPESLIASRLKGRVQQDQLLRTAPIFYQKKDNFGYKLKNCFKKVYHNIFPPNVERIEKRRALRQKKY